MELEGSIAFTQSALSSAQERHQQLKSQHTQVVQQCSNSMAALNAIRSVSNLIPAAPAAEVCASTGACMTNP